MILAEILAEIWDYSYVDKIFILYTCFFLGCRWSYDILGCIFYFVSKQLRG